MRTQHQRWSFTSGYANNTMCDGDSIVFDASGTTGAASYQFFVNGLAQGASSTVATFTPTAALSDGATITVRAYSAFCVLFHRPDHYHTRHRPDYL